MHFRIGNGFDVHRFAASPEAGASIRLGGIDIPHSHRLVAHSDGDVILHALCDALLGALALGDIGQHFPDSDPAYAGIDSTQLLQQVYQLVHKQGWALVNADMTVLAQAPKLAPHINLMREKVAAVLDLVPGQISIKATTTEKLGFTGRREGLACQAVVLLSHPGKGQ